ncbi:MAG: hypothetical protein U0V72_07000 [Cytophagales bacterium]
MLYLKVSEQSHLYLYIFLLVGTAVSMIIIYILFTNSWKLGLGLAIGIDLVILAIHSYTSGKEHKILEINSEGILTNQKLIPSHQIDYVKSIQKFKQEGKMKFDLFYLEVGLQNKETYTFFTNNYQYSNKEIESCIEKNLLNNR